MKFCGVEVKLFDNWEIWTRAGPNYYILSTEIMRLGGLNVRHQPGIRTNFRRRARCGMVVLGRGWKLEKYWNRG